MTSAHVIGFIVGFVAGSIVASVIWQKALRRYQQGIDILLRGGDKQ